MNFLPWVLMNALLGPIPESLGPTSMWLGSPRMTPKERADILWGQQGTDPIRRKPADL